MGRMHRATDANRMRWQFEPGHYEVWYATLSQIASQTGFWIRYTLEAPLPGHGQPSCGLWFARFDGNDPTRTFGFHQTYEIGALRHDAAPFRLCVGDSELRQDGMKGQLLSSEPSPHRVSWDIHWVPTDRVHRHLPSLLYRGGIAETQVLSPNLNVLARGNITVDGQRYDLEDAPLGQTHLWGRKHAYSWAWSHCNAFEADRGAALETLTVRLRRGSIVLPKVTMLSLYLDGGDPCLIEFREPWQLPLIRSDYATGRYHLSAANLQYKIEAEFSCRPEDMLLTEYLDPDGDPAFCHNSECADLRLTVWRRSPLVGRFRHWRTLEARKSAHYEWGARAGDPQVKKRHLRIDRPATP